MQPSDVYNSPDWSTLYNYINQALKYRNNILTKNFYTQNFKSNT